MNPIKLYSHSLGPNPWKCVIIMEELGIPYEADVVDFSVIKEAPFTAVNPNGRVPAIHDPNTDITLWESGAILSYLIDQYDSDNRLSYPQSDTANFHKTNQWLHFQVSGQGPYFGQAAWFRNFHGEKIPSAIERYEKEVKRVTMVLDQHLKTSESPYLVGDKCTYADLSFLPWINMMDILLEKDEADQLAAKHPHYAKWKETLFARPAVKKTFADRAEALAKK